jgi:hypothetical protein
VLLRLAYLGVINTFTLLRQFPMTDRDRDIEILGPGAPNRLPVLRSWICRHLIVATADGEPSSSAASRHLIVATADGEPSSSAASNSSRCGQNVYRPLTITTAHRTVASARTSSRTRL